MHHALSIRDVLDAILSRCPRRTLATLSRTSRLFYEPCIAQLWIHFTEDHLIKLDSMFMRPRSEGLPPNNGKPSVVDLWSRITSYCTLVQTITMRFRRVPHLSATLLHRMTILRPDGPLFPRLQSLSFEVNNPEEFSALMLFARSPLETIDISVQVPTNASWAQNGPDAGEYLEEEHECHILVATLLHRLMPTASVLREFVLCGLSGDRRTPFYRDSLASFIGSATGLQRFGSDYFTLSPDVVRAIASLPRLEEWVIIHSPVRQFVIEDTDGNGEFTEALSMINQDSFPVLRTLHFAGDPYMAPVLLHTLPSTLNSMKFAFYSADRLRPNLFPQLAEAIIARSDPTLLYLELRVSQVLPPGVEEADGMDRTPFSFDIVSPLLQCTVGDFVMDFKSANCIPFDLQNTHLAAMAEAWPHLRALMIEWETCGTQAGATGLLHKSELTLEGLLSFTKCPKLTALVLSEIDTATVPSPLPPTQFTSLRHLEFADYVVQNVDGIANFIHVTFPIAQLVDGYHNRMVARDHGTWGRVWDEMRKLRGQKLRKRRVLVPSRVTAEDIQRLSDPHLGLDPQRYEELTEPVED